MPEDLVVLSQDEYGNVIIPCRPTSPDVNVTLTKDEEEVIELLILILLKNMEYI